MLATTATRIGVLAVTLCAAAWSQAQKTIERVTLMPNLPSPYSMRDWRKVALDYDAIAFDYDRKGQFLPLIASDARHINYDGDSFSIVSFVGQRPQEGPGEAINSLASLVGATLSGVDKSSQNGANYIVKIQKWFGQSTGEKIYLNTPTGHTGETFWYELLPNILASQLNYLYPNTGEIPKQVITAADRYHQVASALGGKADPFTLPDFNHLSFSLRTMTASDNGIWREPDAAAGVAWLEYMAWMQTKDSKYLVAADWGMGFLNRLDYNPFYEMLLPYAAYLAARMNAEQGRDYDVSKLLNWCFDGTPKYRRGWGVIADRWGGLDAHGLVGSTTDGGGYAFAMNTFEHAGALVPLVRYDDRFAHDIGKWMLNLANNSRMFYSNAFDADHQSSFEWSSRYDKTASIAYEGIRKWKRGASTARSDFKTVHGRITTGSYASTIYRKEVPADSEVLEETLSEGTPRLEHIWEFDLPKVEKRWLVVDAKRSGEHRDGGFEFSYSAKPSGPYTRAFTLANDGRPTVFALPAALAGKLYVRVSSTPSSPGETACERISVDAMAVSYTSVEGPYAQGDIVVSFVDLIDDYTIPIVLYRRQSDATDLGLYGSSHVGILGGIVRTTNVTGILQLDLLKTDYYHAPAYPTFLYYNPYPVDKTVEIDVGSEQKDIFDTVSNRFLVRNANSTVSLRIPADTAVVAVLAPAGAPLSHEKGKTLINGIVVDYTR